MESNGQARPLVARVGLVRKRLHRAQDRRLLWFLEHSLLCSQPGSVLETGFQITEKGDYATGSLSLACMHHTGRDIADGEMCDTTCLSEFYAGCFLQASGGVPSVRPASDGVFEARSDNTA